MKTFLRGLALGLVLPLCSPSCMAAGLRDRRAAGTEPPMAPATFCFPPCSGNCNAPNSKLGQLDPAPYFTSYSVYDEEGTVVVGGLGSLLNSTQFHRRTGEVTMRVGSAALDNTHQESRPSGMSSGLIPLQDDPDAVARVLWQLTYEEYRQAAQTYLNVKTAAAVRTQEEDTSADFAEAKPRGAPRLRHAGVPSRSERLGGPGTALLQLFPEVSRDLFLGGDGDRAEDAGAFCFHRRRPSWPRRGRSYA